MEFYATGTKRVKDKKTGEVSFKHYRLVLAADNRPEAAVEAARIARRNGITLGDVLPAANRKFYRK